VTEIANSEQFANWNGESGERWVATADQRDAVLAPVGELLLKTAALRVGERVLDIGCGCGATTIAAAQAVGPLGRVVGLDLSDPMLDVARNRAARVDVGNVAFERGDAQVHHLGAHTFDVAISRFGTMFFNDPAAAFTNIGAALSAWGHLYFATWQPLAANAWLTVPAEALLRDGSTPDLGDGAGMFSQSDAHAIAATLEPAGFADIDTVPAEVRLTVGATTAEAVEYLAATAIGRAVLATIPTEQQSTAIEAAARALADHADATGVHLDGAILITTAIKSVGGATD